MRHTLVAVALAIGTAGPVVAQTGAVRADFSHWTEAALAHRPGTLSATTREVGAWPWDRLKPVVSQLRTRGTTRVLFGAAAMYLDLAFHVPRDERPVYPTRGQGVFSKDGRPVGTHGLDSQIWLARSFVVLALGRPDSGVTERDLASIWFRTVAAMFSQRLNFADLQPHLAEALVQIPDDPGLLFDAGCQAETLASPLIQATIWSRVPLGMRSTGAMGRAGAPVGVSRLRSEAERHYRAALVSVPDARETRVRLGRVLATTGRRDEAVRELSGAAQLEADPIVEYYNSLFLGDALTDARRFDEALSAFRHAASLFPAAGSPHLGISRVHSEQGRLDGARAALDELVQTQPDAAIGGDPRWHYDRCNGRNTPAMYTAFVERFSRDWP